MVPPGSSMGLSVSPWGLSLIPLLLLFLWHKSFICYPHLGESGWRQNLRYKSPEVSTQPLQVGKTSERSSLLLFEGGLMNRVVETEMLEIGNILYYVDRREEIIYHTKTV